jgi:predicted TIM-barrel fold metal-dependent hydrolase
MERRAFLAAAAGAAITLGSRSEATPQEAAQGEGPVIDFHQHTHYRGRSDDVLVAHQRKMGVSLTVLLPAGSKFGLAADAWGNDSVVALSERYPDEFVYFANELPDIRETRQVLEKYLKMGAKGIGEQKFEVPCDSREMQLVYSIAQEFNVPVLMHFQHDKYNTGIERLHKMLEKFPKVTFIGHAQTWWGNVDLEHDQPSMYPKTRITPGGISDRLLSDYPNMYGDLSANSGLNSLLRDEEHARGFLRRHQDKLLWASDCNDRVGEGEQCIGSKGLAAVRRLVPNRAILRKILYENSARLLKRA